MKKNLIFGYSLIKLYIFTDITYYYFVFSGIERKQNIHTFSSQFTYLC